MQFTEKDTKIHDANMTQWQCVASVRTLHYILHILRTLIVI